MICRWCGEEVNELVESCAPCRKAWRERRRWAFEEAQRQVGAFGPRTDEKINQILRKLERSITVKDWRDGARPDGGSENTQEGKV